MISMLLIYGSVSSNLQKIREFIKQVYENRKYTGERNDSNNGERNDKPPRVRLVSSSGKCNANIFMNRL